MKSAVVIGVGPGRFLYREEELPGASLAWLDPLVDGGGALIRQHTWDNPHPDKNVISIDFVCPASSNAGPFCVAMTVEEAADTSTMEER